MVYNGDKRVHALKFQSIVIPNGLIANLFGPVEGRQHDSRMLAMSGLLPKLQHMSFSPTGQAMCIYGDPAYPHRIHLQCPFARRQELTPAQEAFNQSMSQVRPRLHCTGTTYAPEQKVLRFSCVYTAPVQKLYQIALPFTLYRSPFLIKSQYCYCALLKNKNTYHMS